MRRKYKKKRDRIGLSWGLINKSLIIIGVLIGIIGLYLNVAELKNKNLIQSAELMLKFDDYLSKYPNNKIIETIESGNPLLQESGGEFTESQIDGLLGVYNDLDMFFERGLIEKEMVYNTFSYDLVKAYQNEEIKRYIHKLQKEDDELFGGFKHISEFFLEEDKVRWVM